nr:hypothetical protein Itr_chr05CG17630 [Ipomoea trifida]
MDKGLPSSSKMKTKCSHSLQQIHSHGLIFYRNHGSSEILRQVVRKIEASCGDGEIQLLGLGDGMKSEKTRKSKQQKEKLLWGSDPKSPPLN